MSDSDDKSIFPEDMLEEKKPFGDTAMGAGLGQGIGCFLLLSGLGLLFFLAGLGVSMCSGGG